MPLMNRNEATGRETEQADGERSKARVGDEPALDRQRLVGRGVVEDQMNLQLGRHLAVQALKELLERERHLVAIGRPTPSSASISVLGLPVAAASTIRDLCAGARALLRRLAHASRAVLDPLTAMLNRTALEGRAHELAEQSAITGEPVGMIVADLDNFKRVNDIHGHAQGEDEGHDGERRAGEADREEAVTGGKVAVGRKR